MKRSTKIKLGLLFLTASLFAKPAPEWVQNYRTVYPAAEYLVQRGSGDSAEKARTDATAALSRYFQTNVNASLSTTMNSVTIGESIEQKTIVVDDVNVNSQVEFFGLEYTEPYYNKPEKKWYCLVYMNRVDAWQQYKPQIEIKKNTFSGLYKNLQNESDSFTKLGLCVRAWNSAQELLEKLEYGRIINPKEEAAYQTERDQISTIPVIYEEAKQKCSIYLSINTDYNKQVSTSVSAALKDCGFNISKTLSEANYTAEIDVEENSTGSNPLSIKPVISLKIVSKNEKTVYSTEISSAEKAVGYTLESAQKKAYPKLTKELQETVKKELSGFLK